MSDWLTVLGCGVVSFVVSTVVFRAVYPMRMRRSVRRMYNEAFLENPDFAAYIWRKKAEDPSFLVHLD